MTRSPLPILIAGPTASGKSALALALANAAKNEQGGCIINADALQVYGCWRTLSARPSQQEEAEAPHRLYGHVGVTTPYSVGHWLRDVKETLAECQEQNWQPIIVGGTGLYFSALTKGLADIPAVPENIRGKANRFLADQGLEAMLADLQIRDPDSHDYIDKQNPVRVQRAWEVLEATGTGLTQWHRNTPAALLPLESCKCLVMDADRDWLADRIDRRFDLMLDQDALKEVQQAIDAKHDFSLPSMQAIGAAELAGFLKGTLLLDDAIEKGKAQSRQYAKRQRTWFRSKMKDWASVSATSAATDPDLIQSIISG